MKKLYIVSRETFGGVCRAWVGVLPPTYVHPLTPTGFQFYFDTPQFALYWNSWKLIFFPEGEGCFNLLMTFEKKILEKNLDFSIVLLYFLYKAIFLYDTRKIYK